MTVSSIDPKSAATALAAEGRQALDRGDTLLAREKYAAAGRVLENAISGERKQSEKHLLRFLAASQYYHGGDYAQALKVSRRIQESLLSGNVRRLVPQFRRDVEDRARPAYATEVRHRLLDALTDRGAQRVLDTLQAHPFVLDRGAMALCRANACEKLRNFKAAAAYYGDAARWRPDRLAVALDAAALPLQAPDDVGAAALWDYCREQMRLIPSPVPFLAASLVCVRLAQGKPEAEAAGWRGEQIRCLERATRDLAGLDPAEADHAELRWLLALAREAGDSGLLPSDPEALVFPARRDDRVSRLLQQSA